MKLRASSRKEAKNGRVKLFDEVPLIEGSHIVLRPLEDGDAEALGELATSVKVNLYLPTFLYEKQFDDMHEAIRQVYGRIFTEQESLILGICLRGEEHICGLAEYYGLRRDAGKVSIGYRLLERYWGRGIATETVELMLEYLFDCTDISLVTASTLPENAASARVLEKNNFALTERVEEDWGHAEPLPTDKWRLRKQNR